MTATVREALEAMLAVSSNAAAHAFLRRAWSRERQQEMERIGLSQTRIPEPDEDDSQGEGTASATRRTWRDCSG